ncbi:substrate-binding periplasmic protein [Duganella aceris]|uniref:ABC transporter substrate-binding protein n=1 Tax=Duganella aceris TaxID=2703883 RepID=A0ABX0FIX8_9BURK|nr:ABC transporter substrate-binding protein [Duganella aceris]NGZ84464.1 ABC transporter substrate-binding protein [Duganella aceris]
MKTSAVFCAALLLCAGASAAPTVTLRVTAQEGTDPKFIAAGEGRVIGFCVDVFRTIERIDPGLIFTGDQQWMPLTRAHSAVVNRQHDAMCAVQHTEERDRHYSFIEPALMPIHYMLVVRAKDKVVIHSWDDVRQLGAQGVVLANRGYAPAEVLAAMGGLRVNDSAVNPETNLQKLIAGRGRFFLHRNPGLASFIARTGASGKVRILPQVMYSSTLHMAIGNHVDPAVTLRVRHAIEQMERTGELARLLKKWA